jgi:hypothetical protein
MKTLTQKQLKEVLHYNPDTGIFVWLSSRNNNNVPKGSIAGTLRSTDGYIDISIKRKRYRAHILAWLYMKGVWPENDIDHKDTIRHHNWIDNLRDVTRSENLQNQIKARSDNKSTGVLNVYYDKERDKYIVKLQVDGKPKWLGRFSTLKIAEGVALRAKRKYHSTCTI